MLSQNIKRNWPIFVFISFTAIFFITCYLLVSYYYANGLPYYDSVGSYWNMFSIMNTTRIHGFESGIIQAAGFPLSWLQSFYAVFASFILPNTPAALISLNFILLIIAVLCIYWCLRAAGFSKLKSFSLGFLPFFPGFLMEWVGGYVDMRRDASLFTLLTAIYFLTWRYLWAPKILIGIVLGILIGLTQWSRGNALPYLLIIIGVPILIWIIENRKVKNILELSKILIVPLFISLIFIISFNIANWESLLSKYSHHADIGGNRLLSLLTYWNVALLLFFNTNNLLTLISLLLYFCLFISILVLFKTKYLLIQRNKQKDEYSAELIISGILVYLSIMFLNIIILGMINVNGYASFIPFFPLYVGIFSLICGISHNIVYNPKKINIKKWQKIYITIFILFILIFNSLRIYFLMPQRDIETHKQITNITNNLKYLLGGKDVAYLWLDHPNVYDLNFFLTQDGGEHLRGGSYLGPDADTELPPNPRISIKKQNEAFAKGIRNKEYIILSEDLTKYSDPSGYFFIFIYGRPVMESLLEDPSMKKIYRYKYNNIPFVVLENVSINN